MTTASQAIQRTIAQANANPDSDVGCFICKQQLWISFFFDEPGHDAEKEYGTDKLSSLGKLFHAHLDDDSKGIYPLYYNGLGVEFRAPNVARHTTATDIAKGESGAVLKDKAKEAAKDSALGKGKEVLADLKSPKSWGADILGITAKVGLESLDAIRDKMVVSKVTLSGADTRINNALAKLDEVLKTQSLPVSHINIAVFGSGLGGAIGRIFINKLLANCKDRGSLYYPTPKGEATLEVQFLGLLDCISATLDDNPLSDLVVGKLSLGLATLRVKGPMGISEAVQRAVHYVAGHELRVTRRVDSIRKAKSHYFREEALPGSHDDLAGNFRDGVQRRSSQLSRVALQKMHGEAYQGGVPIMSMPKLRKQDIYLFQEFQITAVIQVHAGNPPMPLDRLLMRYSKTAGKLEDQLLMHMVRFIAWMRARFETPNHPARPSEKAYALVFRQIDRLKIAASRGRDYSTEAEYRLRSSWENPMKLDDYQMAIFDGFVHDVFLDSAADMAFADWGNNGYFKLRGIDASDELSE